MKNLIKLMFLGGIAFLFLNNSYATEIFSVQQFEELSKPQHLKSFPNSALKSYHYQSDSNSLISRSINRESGVEAETLVLPMSSGDFQVKVLHKVSHLNGDTTYIGNLLFQGTDNRVVYTIGKGGGIADVFGANTRMRLFVKDGTIWSLDLNHKSVKRKPLLDDVVGELSEIKKTGSSRTKQDTSLNQPQALVVVDTLLLYTSNIVEAYPGGLAETLLNQEVATTNQAFVDSDIEVFLRLVGTQFVDYTKPSDFSALDDLQAALTGQSTDASLTQIAGLRTELGADLVAMIRTHELNERGVCGVARFPGSVPGVLINISNVGDSGGSFCYDTFTHEVGHNFGAGHQQVNGNSVGSRTYSGAYIIADKFNTIMSSIGTGDLNRNYGLNKFSNPNVTCGGIACGNANNADNARTILSFAQQNADLMPTVVEGEVTPFLPSTLDTDGDGVFDDEDAFPFHASETQDSDNDGVGDNQDQFPNNAAETTDTDGDSIGNNADDDDDNDGTLDTLDQLPLDPNETVDTDQDGVGDNADELPNNQDEFADADGDTLGDREDLDDDNDGVNDFGDLGDITNSELIIANKGSNNLLSFNGGTGKSNGVLLSVDEGGFSFRSEIRVAASGEIYFIAFSDVMRFDRLSQNLDVVIDRGDIYTNFPNHLLFKDNADLILNSGANPNRLSQFVKGHRLEVNQLTSSEFEEGLRGMILRLENELLVVSRDQNRIIHFNTDSLTLNNVFSEGAHFDLPEHIVQGPERNFYVSNVGSNNIVKLSTNGDFVSNFVISGSGGLDKPSCLDFGPDGHLYVCSSKTNQILKYNGQSGAFMEVFLDENDEIDQPMGLVFAGAALDDEPYNPNNDSDGDGVNNLNDPFPLDADATLDSDDDQMPDSWESSFGLDPQDAADASLDADGDGNSNLQEYNDGTDPNDASSLVVAQAELEPINYDVEPDPIPEPPESSSGGGSMNWWVALLFFLIFASSLSRRRVKLTE
jgi:hypothetical protein